MCADGDFASTTKIKERVANEWARFFDSYDVQFIRPLDGCISNNWLNALGLKIVSYATIF